MHLLWVLVSADKETWLLSVVHRAKATYVIIVLFHPSCIGDVKHIAYANNVMTNNSCTERFSAMASASPREWMLTLNTMEKVHGDIQVATAWTSLNSTPSDNKHEAMTLHGILSKGHDDYIHHPAGQPLPKQGPILFILIGKYTVRLRIKWPQPIETILESAYKVQQGTF